MVRKRAAVSCADIESTQLLLYLSLSPHFLPSPPRRQARAIIVSLCFGLFYTMESELYSTLNRLLRNRERERLKPFFPYLKLLLQARAKLRGWQPDELRVELQTAAETFLTEWRSLGSHTRRRLRGHPLTMSNSATEPENPAGHASHIGKEGAGVDAEIGSPSARGSALAAPFCLCESCSCQWYEVG